MARFSPARTVVPVTVLRPGRRPALLPVLPPPLPAAAAAAVVVAAPSLVFATSLLSEVVAVIGLHLALLLLCRILAAVPVAWTDGKIITFFDFFVPNNTGTGEFNVSRNLSYVLQE